MSTQYITLIGLFYKKVGILLGGLSDCEELVGVTQRGGGYFDLNIYDLIHLLSIQTRKDFLLDLCLQFNKKKKRCFFRINPRNSRHPIHKKKFLIFLIENQFF